MALQSIPLLEPYLDINFIEAGCDEAGRGCLAGPVCAAAVILPADFFHPLLNDSKKLSAKSRKILRPVIEKQAIAFAVAMISPKEIDQLNILKASFKAMHVAVSKLSVIPQQLLIDGNRFVPYPSIPHHCIVKGDGKFASIAAASILAKTYRDDYMLNLDKKFPAYCWYQNKGYPTKVHRQAIRENGMTVHHRKSFTCLPEQVSIGI